MRRGLNVNAAPFMPLAIVANSQELEDNNDTSMGFIGGSHHCDTQPSFSACGYGVFPIKDENHVATVPIGMNENQVEMMPPQEQWIPLDNNDNFKSPTLGEQECMLKVTETEYRNLVEKSNLLNVLLCDLRNLQHPIPIYAVDKHEAVALNLESQVNMTF